MLPSPFAAAIFTIMTGLAVAQVRPFPRPLAIPMANQAANQAAAGRPPMMMAGPMGSMMAGPMGGQAAAAPPPAPPKPVVTRAQLRNQEVWRTDVAYMTTAFLTISSLYFWVLSKVHRSLDGDGSRVVLVPRTDSPVPLDTLGWILDAVATRDTRRCVDALICTLSSKRQRDLAFSQKVIVEFFGSMRNFIAVEPVMPRARFAFAAALGRARTCQSFVLGCPVDIEKLALHV